ncbi:follicular dendritic cell secreted peptide [Sarcophilus harrisii]|uniref:follicular dendritic cell secreted peptide n=1 Tax=Sarcophilus harrisii TaxID=9305 RepID=UPI001301B69F|nr:follicular dendritic cell secreted peptide [Sarcophilus harrisii]
MKALLTIAIITITLGFLAAQDQEREKRSVDSGSYELLPRFYRNRYQYPFGLYQPFAYPRYRWPIYYIIPGPAPAAPALSNK